MGELLPLTGFGVGILIGLTGMGGGAIMTPFLILVLGTRPLVAVGSDLVYGAVTKIVGAYLHWRQGTVDLRVVRRLATTSVPAGLAAVVLLRLLPHWSIDADAAIRNVLGVVLICVGALVLARLSGLLNVAVSPRWGARLQEPGTPIAGAVVGLLVGFTSVGSGSLLIPFLMTAFRLRASRVVGTDVFHAAILVTVTALGHVHAGSVDWGLTGALLAGSIPGVALGSWLAPRVPARALRAALGGLLLVTGVTLI